MGATQMVQQSCEDFKEKLNWVHHNKWTAHSIINNVRRGFKLLWCILVDHNINGRGRGFFVGENEWRRVSGAAKMRAVVWPPEQHTELTQSSFLQRDLYQMCYQIEMREIGQREDSILSPNRVWGVWPHKLAFNILMIDGEMCWRTELSAMTWSFLFSSSLNELQAGFTETVGTGAARIILEVPHSWLLSRTMRQVTKTLVCENRQSSSEEMLQCCLAGASVIKCVSLHNSSAIDVTAKPPLQRCLFQISAFLSVITANDWSEVIRNPLSIHPLHHYQYADGTNGVSPEIAAAVVSHCWRQARLLAKLGQWLQT